MPYSKITNKIAELTGTWMPILEKLPDDVYKNKRNWQNRSIIQVVGHMIDSASNNHQRIVRLQYTKQLVFPDYRQDNDLWIAIQDYQHADWQNIIQLWKFYNLHIIHIIQAMDLNKLENYWNDFEGTKVTLEQMIEGYLWHLELHLKEIEVVLHEK
jgi:hypothetical protein